MAGMLKCNTASSDLTLSVSFLAIKNRLRISPNRVERGNSTAQPRTGEATQLDQEKKNRRMEIERENGTTQKWMFGNDCGAEPAAVFSDGRIGARRRRPRRWSMAVVVESGMGNEVMSGPLTGSPLSSLPRTAENAENLLLECRPFVWPLIFFFPCAASTK